MVMAVILLTMFAKICIHGSCEVYEESRNLLVTLRSDELSPRRIKVIRSMKPLVINVGSFYFIKVSTFTTYSLTVVDNTINVVLGMQ